MRPRFDGQRVFVCKTTALPNCCAKSSASITLAKQPPNVFLVVATPRNRKTCDRDHSGGMNRAPKSPHRWRNGPLDLGNNRRLIMSKTEYLSAEIASDMRALSDQELDVVNGGVTEGGCILQSGVPSRWPQTDGGYVDPFASILPSWVRSAPR
jgi:hypothetical protein